MTLARRLILAAASIRIRHILDEDDDMPSHSVTVTAAKLADLHNTPVELVPAPGEGKARLPLCIIVGKSPTVDEHEISGDYTFTQNGNDVFQNGPFTSPGPGGGVAFYPSSGVGYDLSTAALNVPILLGAPAPWTVTDPETNPMTLTLTTVYAQIDIPS